MRICIVYSLFFVLFFCLCGFATSSGFGEHDKQAESISLIQLIANPSQWHNKVVHVPGVLILQFEGDAIYLNSQDANNHITKNAIWVNINYEKFGISENEPDSLKEYKKNIEKLFHLRSLVNKYVYIEGKFNKDSQGHLGLYSGEIDVTRIYEIEK